MTISQNPSAPLVVVIGSTGSQGGSTIRELALSDRPYRIRGLTRDTNKPAAQALIKQGVEMVAVSTVPEEKESLFSAFQGATYAFAMTQSASKVGKDTEVAEGKMYVDAAKSAKVELLIWSGLVDMNELSGSKYPNVYHMDSKAEVTKYAEEVGVPLVNVMAGLFMTNFSGYLAAPKKQGDGSFVLSLPVPPDSTVPLLDTSHDYGLFVRKAIESAQGASQIEAYGEVISYRDMMEQLSEVTGKKVKFAQISEEQFLKDLMAVGRPRYIAQEYLEMHLAIHDHGYFGHEDVRSRPDGLTRLPHTWREFATATDWSEILN
ncbi:hypothetical protein FRB98_009218 [Tulasnella sp. 332]|nr:hypothetical protein FRB98_009218 [Tulasnella sp. 332]